MLQNFEMWFANTPRFVPNLLYFHTNANIYKGVYEEDALLGTFVLQPYCDIHGPKVSKVLRIERPLAKTTLSDKKRSEVFEEMRSYAIKFAESHSYDFIEMELYDRIDDEIFFPSSLSTIGTFNLAEDFKYLRSGSFEEVKTTLCFEFLSEKGSSHGDRGKHKIFESLGRLLNKWRFAEQIPRMVCKQFYIYKTVVVSSRDIVVVTPHSLFSFPLTAFNFPRYFLIKRGAKSAVVQWYPDLFLLSKNNWTPLIDSMEEVRRRVMSIDRAKIYRILGFSADNLLSNIEKIWTKGPLSHASKLQIFSDMRHYDAMSKAGGKLVHTLRLLRKNVLRRV